jgi:hypothetical protein
MRETTKFLMRPVLTARQPVVDTPIAEIPVVVSPVGDLPVGELPARRKNAPKVREIIWVQDGHSRGEQAVYDAMWSAGTQSGQDRRFARLGYRDISDRCGGMDPSNVRKNVHSLIKKRTVDVAEKHSEGKCQAYWVYGFKEVLRRWREDGYTHVIRGKGAQRLKGRPPVGETPIGDLYTPIGDTPTPPVGDLYRSPIRDTPTPSLLGNCINQEKEAWAREKLKDKHADPHDIAIARRVLESDENNP